MSAREQLRAVVGIYSEGETCTVPVPLPLLRELLSGEADGAEAPGSGITREGAWWGDRPYLDAHDLAGLLGRDESTVRGYFREGRFPGSYRFGREWRTTPRGFQAYLDALSREHQRPDIAPEPTAQWTPPNLGDWRKLGKQEGG